MNDLIDLIVLGWLLFILMCPVILVFQLFWLIAVLKSIHTTLAIGNRRMLRLYDFTADDTSLKFDAGSPITDQDIDDYIDSLPKYDDNRVTVASMVERRTVNPECVGSTPTGHPNF